MKISFFEEFPTLENIKKLELVDFPTTVFLAARSLREFRYLERKGKEISKIAEFAYWPVLEKKEGYWLSPFSSPRALDRVIKELEKAKDLRVLWDAELPLLRPQLFLMNSIFFFRNRRKIKKFLAGSKSLKIYSAEVPAVGFLMKILGVSFDENVTGVPMCYASMAPFVRRYIKNSKSPAVGIGLIAKGVGPVDRVYSPKELEKDIILCQDNKNIQEAIIFRLSGLNKGYLKAIKKFI